MPLTSNPKSYGVREIKIISIPAGTTISLPAAQKLTIKEVLTSGELRGNDALVATAAFLSHVEWSLENGGMAFDAIKAMTGRTVTGTGTTPNQKNTITAKAGDSMPYFKILGKVLTDDGSDVHCIIYSAKLTDGFEGEWSDGEFFVQGCSGIGVADSAGKIYDLVHNETAAALPSS